MQKLNEFCSTLPTDSYLFLLGDFNARTGGSNTISGNDEAMLQNLANGDVHLINDLKGNLQRNSKDTVRNDRGERLIDFGCEWNLTILNGSIVGDILGNWTCYRYNGNSIVDYMLISHDLRDRVSSLKILELSELSDHRPLLCTLRTLGSPMKDNIEQNSFEDKPLGFKWITQNQESKLKFIAA